MHDAPSDRPRRTAHPRLSGGESESGSANSCLQAGLGPGVGRATSDWKPHRRKRPTGGRVQSVRARTSACGPRSVACGGSGPPAGRPDPASLVRTTTPVPRAASPPAGVRLLLSRYATQSSRDARENGSSAAPAALLGDPVANGAVWARSMTTRLSASATITSGRQTLPDGRPGAAGPRPRLTRGRPAAMTTTPPRMRADRGTQLQAVRPNGRHSSMRRRAACSRSPGPAEIGAVPRYPGRYTAGTAARNAARRHLDGATRCANVEALRRGPPPEFGETRTPRGV